MAAPTPPARPAAAPEEQRLELEDFECSAGGQFDPVVWLNARLAKSGVAFDKLDQHLSALAMRCQLLCQDASESIEVASNQLVAQLPSTGRDLERMREQALRGREQLGKVLDGLRDADDRKQSGLHGLAEIDAVKTRVETACSALREVGSWERKVRDCEQQIHSGKLSNALQQLASLKGVLDAFRMLPEYAKKEGQLSQLEENLLAAARRRARLALERNVAADLGACGEVCLAAGGPEEPRTIAEAVFAEIAEKAWLGQDPRGDASAAALAAVARAVLEAVAQAFRERWPLLQALDEQAGVATGGSPSAEPQGGATQEAAAAAAGAGTGASVVAAAVRAALQVLSARLEPCLASPATGAPGAGEGEESSVHLRASRAVALFAEYSEGFSALAQCAPMAEAPALWAEACGASGAGQEALPWGLLREVATFVVWRPMQDDAANLAPPSGGRPAEAVLAAESNAKKLMQMPPTWARYLEEKGGARLAVVWLACIDATCEAYWKSWDGLVATFQKTVSLKAAAPEGGASDCTYDSALLNECMQLHSVLHDTISAQFLAFQSQVLQLATRMYSSGETPLGRAIAEKLRDDWCDRLATPSAEALRAAQAAVEGSRPEVGAAPLSVAALGKVEQQVRGLVTQCCVQPVLAVLAAYSEAKEWARAEEAASLAFTPGGLSPLPCITAVGEHLFALMPQLERPQEGGPQVQWLPAILEAVVETTTQKVLQIKQLTPLGAQQLITDLEYLQKVTDALGSGAASSGAEGTAGDAAAKLGEILATLRYLAEQQQRQRESAARGEALSEAPRAGPALPRRAERALRAALGLGSAAAA